MINSILYDKTENGESRVITEVLHPTSEAGGQEGGGKTSSLLFVSQGNSVAVAVREEGKSVDKVLFGGQNQARLFSERFAQKGIGSVVDFLSRDYLTDETPLMVMVQGDDPEQIYKCRTGLAGLMGDYLAIMSQTQHLTTCQSVFVTTLSFTKDFYNDGKQPVMGLLKIQKNELAEDEASGKQSGGSSQESEKNKDLVLYEGLAAFKDDKLVGYMNGEEARVYNILTGDFTVDAVAIPSGKKYTTGILKGAKAKIETSFNDSKQAEIDINIKTQIGIVQEGGDIDISKSDELEKKEEEFNKFLSQQVMAAVEKAQDEFRSDIFGFGNYVHAQHPEEWKEIKKEWDIYFSKAKINVTVESSIVRQGEIKMPFVFKEKTDE
jgi:spore germination protein KC